MPRRPPVALVAVALAAACSGSGSGPRSPAGPVAVTPRAVAAETAACRVLVDGLPGALGTVPRRTTTDAATTAAWGDPPVTLACGGPSGSTLDDAFSVDGMRFALHDTGPGRTWTTLDRRPAVVVTFPDHYENQGELVGYLVPALRR